MSAFLTEQQFAAAQNTLDARLRATKRGTPERAAVDAQVAIWEAACALPAVSFAQREVRFAAIAKAAVELGL